MMNILVTGATGYIGRCLCQALISNGHHVTALVRKRSKSTLSFLGSENLTFLESSIEDIARCRDIPQQDYVFHFAAALSPPTTRDYFRVNSLGTSALINYLDRQKWKPKKVIFASSIATLEVDKGDSDPYSLSKYLAESLLERSSYSVLIFRIGAVYDETMVLFKLIQFISGKLNIGFRLPDELNVKWSFIHVSDLVRLMCDAVDTNEAGYFNVTHEEVMSVESLFQNSTPESVQAKMITVPAYLLNGLYVIVKVLIGFFSKEAQTAVNQAYGRLGNSYCYSSKKTVEAFKWKPRYGSSMLFGRGE